MAKYSAKVGEWISPSENTGSIQNLGNSPIEISSINTENTGIKLESGQMVNFDGTVYVRSMGNKPSTFTTSTAYLSNGRPKYSAKTGINNASLIPSTKRMPFANNICDFVTSKYLSSFSLSLSSKLLWDNERQSTR